MLAGPDLLVILAIALIVFGPKKLPEIAKTVGKVLGELKKTTDEMKEGIGIKELGGIKGNLSKMDFLTDLAEKTSKYMTHSESTQEGSVSKDHSASERTLSQVSDPAENEVIDDKHSHPPSDKKMF